MKPVRLFCSDFEKAGIWNTRFCCNSCHDDDEEGWADLGDMEPPDKSGEEQYSWEPTIYAYACCALRTQDLTRSDWAKAVLVKRGWALK